MSENTKEQAGALGTIAKVITLPKTYKAELLIGTAPYSNIKIYIEGTSGEIIAANDKLLKHYAPKQN